MPIEVINTGTVDNDGTGDSFKLSMTKVNANFVEQGVNLRYVAGANRLRYSRMLASTGWIASGVTPTYNQVALPDALVSDYYGPLVRSVQLVVPSAGDSFLASDATGNRTKTSNTVTLTVSAYVRATTSGAGGVRLRLIYFNGASVVSDRDNLDSVASPVQNQWYRLVGSYSETLAHDRITLRLQHGGTGTYQWAGIQIQAGGVVTPYFPNPLDEDWF